MRRQLLRTLVSLALVGLGVSCREDAESPTAPAAELGPAAAIVTAALAFRELTTGGQHSCGVTTTKVAYCWGQAQHGELGDGTSSDDPLVDILESRPVAVSGGLRFHSVIASTQFTCGLTMQHLAYCWGSNYLGLLGNGSTTRFVAHPVPVLGGLRFRQLSPYGIHVCGVTMDHQIYCWGDNSRGQLGDGTLTSHSTPARVLGDRKWREVTVGYAYTCGITLDGVTYCWGENRLGQLGDGTAAELRVLPSRVAGAHHFVQVDAGWDHTCGVTVAGQAFCWGNGDHGALGNGETSPSSWPRAVSGGHLFRRVSTGTYGGGGAHTCGTTRSQQIYCWGFNNAGQVGDGTTTNRLIPVPVAGGHRFVQVWAGHMFTCGTTATALAYCWGYNAEGQLGDGTTTRRLTPVPVLGPG